jgi:hypothetical protein
MLDITVYLDALKAPGLPAPIQTLVARNVALHCATACAELAVSIGHLNPVHPQTAAHRAPLVENLQRMVPSRIISPSADAWIEAAVIAGILARVQTYAREDRRAVLHDALMLLTAIEADAVLLSRNIRHMDLLLRFRPDARALLYDRASPRGPAYRRKSSIVQQTPPTKRSLIVPNSQDSIPWLLLQNELNRCHEIR